MPQLWQRLTSSIGAGDFSLAGKTLCFLGLPALTITCLITSPVTAAVLPITLSPTAWLLRRWGKLDPQKRGHLETLIWIYTLTGTVGVVGVMALQAATVYLSTKVIFGEQADAYMTEFLRKAVDLTADDKLRRRDMALSWRYLAFLGVSTFVVAGLLEESLKYLSLVWARRSKRPITHEAQYLQYAIAAGLGFSTIEMIAFVAAESKSKSLPMLALTVLERVALGTPGHVLNACLISIYAIRRDIRREALSFWQVVGPSVFYHGVFDFVLFAISASNGNIGWVHPTDFRSLAIGVPMILGITGTLAWQVYSGLRTLQPTSVGHVKGD